MDKLITAEEAEKIATEFAEVTKNWLDSKGLGENYGIAVVQGIRNSGDGTDEPIMTGKTFLWNGNDGLHGNVGRKIAMELNELSRTIVMNKLGISGDSLPDLLRSLAERMSKPCDCPNCTARREAEAKKQEAPAEGEKSE